jgi:ribosomal protein S27E
MPKKRTTVDEPRWDDVISRLPEDETFSIGQVYDDHAATTVKCAQCGGTEFKVGLSYCYTAISCPTCKWEKCVHDG